VPLSQARAIGSGNSARKGRTGVITEDFNETGRVYLELADATPAEAARGMALLTKLAG
jgi:hypothetical protein